MKKILIIVFVLLFVVPAFALNVGDKMPDTSGVPIQREVVWTSFKHGNTGSYIIRAEKEYDPIFIFESFLTCGGVKGAIPFGIYLSAAETLYLDGDMDGIIDGKITEIPSRVPALTPANTAPECPKI